MGLLLIKPAEVMLFYTGADTVVHECSSCRLPRLELTKSER
jgi:hypothetical protein